MFAKKKREEFMNIKKLMKLLEKRAKGFVYEEVQEEFATKCNTTNFEKNLDSENCAENKGEKQQGLALDCAENEKKDDAEIGLCEVVMLESPPKRKRGRPKKVKDQNDGKDLGKNDMVLVKKKIHTFFVPPDMTAIKMLLEIEGKVSGPNDEDVMELAEKRKMLLEEIKRELLGDDE